MSGFLRVTMLLGSVTALSLVVQIVRTKLVAIHVGREGMALVAQFSDLQMLVAGLLLLGADQGMVAVATDAYARGDPEILHKTLKMLRRWLFPLALLVLTALTAAAPWLLPQITGQPNYVLPGMLALAALAAQLWVRPWTAIINGARAFQILARARLAETLVSFAVLVPLVLMWRVQGALYSLAAVQVVGLATTWWAFRRLAPPTPNDGAATLPPIDNSTQTLVRFGAATLVGGLISTGLSLALRREIISLHGLEQSGLYQVAFALTQQYLTLVLGAMSAYSFPAYRAVHNQPQALSQEVNHTLRGALLVIVPIIAVLLVLREPFILVLFTEEYLPAEAMLRLQLLGDLFKVVAWAIGVPILAAGRAGTHIALEVLFASSWLVGVWGWSQLFGVLGAPIGFLVNQILVCVVYIVVIRRQLGIGIDGPNWRLLGLSSAVLIATALVAGSSLWVSVPVAAAMVALWAWLCVQRSEWQGLLTLVRERLGRLGVVKK